MREDRSALVRHVAVTVAYVVCVVGSLIGVGLFGGTPIAEAAGGVLAADSTHLAPDSPAFSVWSVIYAGLGLYTLWQWWDRADRRRIAWPVVASLVLNAAWILTVQAGRVWWSVVVIVALLAVLALTFQRLLAVPPRSRVEALVADGTMGLYLGWVSVATCANIAAALLDSGFTGGGAPEWWAVGVLAAVAVIGTALALVGRGRLAPAATIVWGLSWIAVARTSGAPESTTTAATAVTAAAVVAVVTIVVRLRTGLDTRVGRQETTT
ncbi:tryptophan-rich sensory protein [Georgenia satyanarayanai]|uniref:tryptophan-rich sensory protein n=1 Tax=Georgenia satyanarayanai TaxID=860221 RepID=UPI0012647254|nr:tryptophan-rich sensory protein [Georgenia satyanarayanai]